LMEPRELGNYESVYRSPCMYIPQTSQDSVDGRYNIHRLLSRLLYIQLVSMCREIVSSRWLRELGISLVHHILYTIVSLLLLLQFNITNINPSIEHWNDSH